MRIACVGALGAFFLGSRACTRTPEVSNPGARAPSHGSPGKTGTAQLSGTVTTTVPGEPAREGGIFPECGKRSPQSPLRVSPEGRLTNAFVWIKEGVPAGDYPLPATPLLLDQKACDYLPRVFGIRAGQPILVKNSDPLLHNVHALGQGAGPLSGAHNAFNVAMPLQDMSATRRFDEPQVMVTITCDVHPWMRAFAGVVDHPFFAVTGEDGSFRIPGLPAGEYLVEAWHERLGRRTRQVTLAEGQAAAADFAFAP